MKMKEAQLLGILAIIAGGIIILSLWGSQPADRDPDGTGGIEGEVASGSSSGRGGEPMEDWMWLTEEEGTGSDGAEGENGSSSGTASLSVEGEKEAVEAETNGWTELGTEDPAEELGEDLSTQLEESPPGEIGIHQREELGGSEETTSEPASQQQRPHIYEVKKGDTLVEISRKHYETQSGWKNILRANRDVLTRPEDLRPEMKLVIPGESSGQNPSVARNANDDKPLLAGEDSASEAGKRYHEVQKRGTTLWTLAKKYYGEGSQYKRILKANSDILDKPSDLKKGMRIVVPE